MKNKLGIWILSSVLIVSAAAVLIAYIALGSTDGQEGASSSNFGSEVVARVNDEEILKEDLYEEMYASATPYGITLGEQTLETLIEDLILKQEASKQGIEITEEDIEQKVDEEIEAVKLEIGDDFDRILAQNGMTEEMFRQDLAEQLPIQMLAEKLFEDEIEITDEQISEHYEAYQEFYGEPEQIELSEIITATREEAEQALAELENGADFADIADQYAENQAMPLPGGSHGWVSRGMLHPELEEAAFALESEERSDIIETEQGFHILFAHDKQEEHIPELDEIREQIRKELFAEELNALVPAWLEEKKREADIER